MSEPFWVDIPNLRLAAAKLDDEGRKILDILQRLRSQGEGLTDPAVFGVGDNAGDRFYPKWKSYMADLEDGVKDWGESVLGTAEGVRAMATMFEKADDSAEERAAAIERAMGSLASPSAPLAAPQSGARNDSGSTSSGNSDGGGRH